MGNIITSNGGEPRKVVDMRNNPIQSNREEAPGSVRSMPKKERIGKALHDLANKIESGELPEPDYVLVLPRLQNGQLPLFVFGDEMPHTMLLGTLQKLVTRMALE